MRAKEGKSKLRNAFIFISILFSQSHSDVLKSMGQFRFINPGITLTKDGPGFEVSAGRNGTDLGEPALFGALVRYEPSLHRAEAGLEAGIAIFLVEAGFSYSEKGSGVFMAPNLSLPIPASRDRWMVLNLCYRLYPTVKGTNSFGASLKFAFMR